MERTISSPEFKNQQRPCTNLEGCACFTNEKSCGRADIILRIQPTISQALLEDINQYFIEKIAKFKKVTHEHEFIQKLFSTYIVNNTQLLTDTDHLIFRPEKTRKHTINGNTYIELTFGRRLQKEMNIHNQE